MDFRDILFVSDFDHTLTNMQNDIPRENIDAIERFIAGGGVFTVGTGRAKASFAPQFPRVPTNAPIVAANGALIYDYAAEKTVGFFPLADVEWEKIRALARRFDETAEMTVEVGLEIYRPSDIGCNFPAMPNVKISGDIPANMLSVIPFYESLGVKVNYTTADEIPEPRLKAVFTGAPEVMDTLAGEAAALGLIGTRSMTHMFEIQGAGVNKGTTARRLAESLGRKVLVCAGDAPNDLAMLHEADYAFVPESADPAMRLPGFRVCSHIDSGAVADIIRTLEAL